MEFDDHFRITGTALKNWFIAQTQDAFVVGILWFVGTLIIGLPWAPLWGVIGFFCQYIPNVGGVFALIGPAFAAMFADGGWEQLIYVLILYVVIVVVDGLFLQPWLMKRTTKVPIWASIVTPLVLGIFLNFWGVLLSAPLLSILYAYKAHNQRASQPQVLPPDPQLPAWKRETRRPKLL